MDVLSANNDELDGYKVSTIISLFQSELKLSDGRVVLL